MNIYVSNLNFRTRGESLQTLFGEYGEVSSANVITDRETGRSRGFGFVEMPDESAARNAINALNGFELDERAINVNEARPKTERSDRGGYGSNRAAVTDATGIDSDRPERAGGSVERPPRSFDKAVLFPAGDGAEVSGGALDGRPVGWTGVGARTELLPERIVLSLQDAGEIFWPGCLAETVNYAYLCPR
mgnify:CR=1 FL=1